jgi:hypothetical protein
VAKWQSFANSHSPAIGKPAVRDWLLISRWRSARSSVARAIHPLVWTGHMTCDGQQVSAPMLTRCFSLIAAYTATLYVDSHPVTMHDHFHPVTMPDHHQHRRSNQTTAATTATIREAWPRTTGDGRTGNLY